ncbi:hypothetical protein GCM10009718_33140 [Isoptericola halotolerans]|uniref:Uncharacterized protein n=1 Tax=Isoptericola halotolerans TaxID=300560 RepID=A0ABX2A5S1_9MICO|nr:hypothetical protein [Isoptericola halotolerans]NOV98202.1 hypothetical protein [Isoptericola halotolerans]
MTLDELPLGTVLDELASTYETVASLPAVVERIGGASTGKPGSKLPPGMSETLDVDEHERAVHELDEWAEFVGHVLLDEGLAGPVPDSTPGRLRFAATWSTVVENHPDIMLRYALQQDAREHLVTMRRLSRRGTRKVRTESACMDVACTGQFVATIDGPEVDGYIVCDRCGMRVEKDVWERWGSRSEWITVERAMTILGVTTKQAVWQRAKRGKWRRQGDGRHVRYHAEDVRGETSGRMSA